MSYRLMRKRVGFTLIEVLVVVAIIALLVSISVPAFAAVRRNSKRTVCLSNLQQIATAIQSYLHNNRDTFYIRTARVPAYPPPPPNNPPMVPEPPAKSLPQMLKRELAAMGGQRTSSGDEAQFVSKIFECPADVITDPIELADPNVGGRGPRYFDSQTTSYEWNDVLNGVNMSNKKKVTVLEVVIDQNGQETKKPLDVLTKNLYMVNDFWRFHGEPNQRNNFNILFANFELKSIQMPDEKQKYEAE